jgi:hypothetical protein
MRKPGTGPHVPDASELAARAAEEAKGKPGQGDATSTDTKGGEEKKGDDKKPPYRWEPDPDAPLRPHRASPRAELIIKVKSPRVLITPDAYKRMNLYIEIAPKEVGWLGTVKRLDNGDFLIEEVFLVEQEVTGVETEMSVEGREKLVLDLLAHGDAGLDKSNTLHFWGHSHVRMSTGPSGTDENTMMQFGNEGHPYYIRGIFTKLGRGEFTLYLYEQGYRVLDAPWAVWDPKEGILLEPKPFPSHSWSGGHSWERDSGDGGSIFGFKREEPGVIKKDKPLHPLLVPDEALRAAVQAEYDAKVSERRFFFRKWWGKDDDDQSEQVTDGDCIPTGFDTGDGAPAHIRPATGQPVPSAAKQPAKPAESSGGISGFFDWFFGLFSSPSQPATPPNRPATPPPAGPPANKDAAPTAPRPGNEGTEPAAPTGPQPGDSTPSDKSGK